MTRSSWKSALNLALGVLIILIGAAILFPVFAQHKGSGRSLCLSNVKQMVLGCLIYSSDFDDKLPPASRWTDDIVKYDAHFLVKDPEGTGEDQGGYAFRQKASSLKSLAIAKTAEFELIFDSTFSGRNQYSEPSTMPHPGRHNGWNSVGFLDGHARKVKSP
jgi:prepilin-type processing-associated H-X9-DG protein